VTADLCCTTSPVVTACFLLSKVCVCVPKPTKRLHASGVIREVAKRVFNMDVTLTVVGRNARTIQMTTGERMEEHTMFLIQVPHAHTHSLTWM
jgi:hypothetical protein